MSAPSVFEDFEIRASDDPAKIDLELVCPHCNGVVCDVEHGDSLGTLTRCAEDHAASCGLARVSAEVEPGGMIEVGGVECVGVQTAHGLVLEPTCSGLSGEHHWLDRPESDTRECLVCGTERV